MPYIPHTARETLSALKVSGAETVEDLLKGIPPDIRLKSGLNLPDGVSEQELAELMKRRSRKNSGVDNLTSFLGAGAYNHYIPAIVDAVVSRSEFYTAYTPYQPEISQGTLQAIFEYQTLVCQLTGMDVANASLYDGASAIAEAGLMARRITGRERILLSSAVHPEYRETIKTYLKGAGDHIREVFYCTETGTTLPEAVEAAMGAGGEDAPACLIVQHPNFFGSLEDLDALAAAIHKKKGMLVVVVTEPVSLGLLKPPAEHGADIAVGENQSFGNALSYGGPYLGFMAVKAEFVRQMPGRLVGQTTDKNGLRAFCLTFATREQHIRRERATSNICTNHGLCALAASVHLASLGQSGLRGLSLLNHSKAEYLKRGLNDAGIKAAFNAPTFNEFTIRLDKKDAGAAMKSLLKKGIIAGLALERFYPELAGHVLIAATEMNSKEDMDRFISELQKT